MSEPAPRREVPSALQAVGAIAAVTLVRLRRGRALWVGALIALLPVAFAHVFASRAGAPSLGDVFVFEVLVLAVLPAMFVASAVGEDIEDRTATYLWSRPVPRWAVLAGKLVALAPWIAGLTLGSWFLVARTLDAPPPAGTYTALAAGCAGMALLAAGVATVVPRHGMALTIGFLLFFDLPLGILPAQIGQLSITRHVRVIAEVDPSASGSPATSLAAIAALGGAWLALGLWRIRRLEA